MKKTIRKTMALGMAVSMMSSVSAIANSNLNTAISVNGNEITAQAVTVEGKTLLPVRAVASALDINVNWDSQNKAVVLENMPLYITFRVGVDGYTFAKTAPMPLGQAPIIIDSVTYVPQELFTDILALNVESTSSGISISSNAESTTETTTVETTEATTETTTDATTETTTSASENATEETTVETLTGTGKIVDVTDKEVIVDDTAIGEVRLNANENTKITDKDGKNLKFSDIKLGDEIQVVYGDVMTFSIPPLNNPISIVVLG